LLPRRRVEGPDNAMTASTRKNQQSSAAAVLAGVKV